MRISVKEQHISSAKPYPSLSPVALAIQMGFDDVSVTHYKASFDGKVYELPETAKAAERNFDFLAKGGSTQGEIAQSIVPYEFDLITDIPQAIALSKLCKCGITMQECATTKCEVMG
jgi:hypothetical protein